ncbi:carbon-nitrogen hydrolase family protein [Mycobacterium sp.]|uniref:carbon-nitrogen hydrolase family protein n=1 Tax=Mycobacterium sp. TaxID=1785 RepID=UPI003F80E25F
MSNDSAGAPSPTIRAAAIQMLAELGDVDANLAMAERLVRVAFERGANLVVLPEFYASGNAFYPHMASATRTIDGQPAQVLLELAREGNAVVGGSFLAWRDGNVYNSFVLALPDGSIHRHDKDAPTFWENCYYIGGNDDGVLPTPQGNIGAALCWEFIRSRTATRLRGKVDIVVGGSGWWGGLDSGQSDGPSADFGLEIMKAAPSRFAKMLGVPVIHAAHAGRFVGQSWPDSGESYPSRYLGEAQIVDGHGRILARMSRAEGEGVITADVVLGPVADEPEAIPDSFWIAEFPEAVYRQWESDLETGHQYYLSTTLPYVREMFTG